MFAFIKKELASVIKYTKKTRKELKYLEGFDIGIYELQTYV